MIFLNDDSHLKIGKGRTKLFTRTIKDPDGSIHQFGSNPIAILGIKRNADSNTLLFTIASNPDTQTGKVTFIFKPEYTQNMQPGSYFYDIALHENGSSYATVVEASIFDILPVASMISDVETPTYVQSPAPDIIICNDLEYSQLGDYHPEKYAVVVQNLTQNEASSIANAIENASGIAGLLTPHTVSVHVNGTQSVWNSDYAHSYVSSISIGQNDVGGNFSYGLTMVYRRPLQDIVEMLSRILSGDPDYMQDYFEKCIKFVDNTQSS